MHEIYHIETIYLLDIWVVIPHSHDIARPPSPNRAREDTPMSQSAAHALSTASPYIYLPKVPSFHLSSETITDGQPLPPAQLSPRFGGPGGEAISPPLSRWAFPAEAKSCVVSMYDPQPPTGSGFWHWVFVDIPASTTSLPPGAGTADGTLL